MLSCNPSKGTVAIYRKNVDGLGSSIITFEYAVLVYIIK
jgi:hypothetical protein